MDSSRTANAVGRGADPESASRLESFFEQLKHANEMAAMNADRLDRIVTRAHGGKPEADANPQAPLANGMLESIQQQLDGLQATLEKQRDVTGRIDEIV